MSAAVILLRAMEEEPPPCTEEDPELFFTGPDSASNDFRERRAKSVCKKCPLIYKCLEFALETGDRWAIMGGTNPGERAKILDLRKAAEEAEQVAA